MTPVADECRAQTTKDDIDSNANGKKKACRDDVHAS